jgi:hypothetical protein
MHKQMALHHAVAQNAQDLAQRALRQGEECPGQTCGLEERLRELRDQQRQLDTGEVRTERLEALGRELTERMDRYARWEALELQDRVNEHKGLVVREREVSWTVEPKSEPGPLRSPEFNCLVDGQELRGLSLAFWPRGALDAPSGFCSLYLEKPFDLPWVQYCLFVGQERRGPLDTLFGGTDDFCRLEPTTEVTVRVEFLSSRKRSTGATSLATPLVAGGHFGDEGIRSPKRDPARSPAQPALNTTSQLLYGVEFPARPGGWQPPQPGSGPVERAAARPDALRSALARLEAVATSLDSHAKSASRQATPEDWRTDDSLGRLIPEVPLVAVGQ